MNMTTTADFLRMIGNALSTTLRDLTNRAKSAHFDQAYAWRSQWVTATITCLYFEAFKREDGVQRIRAGLRVDLAYRAQTEVTSGSDDWAGVR